jgi:hypothetical protein
VEYSEEIDVNPKPKESESVAAPAT